MRQDAALMSYADRQATEILADVQDMIGPYAVVHGLVAYAYAKGQRDGYTECAGVYAESVGGLIAELPKLDKLPPGEPDPRD